MFNIADLSYHLSGGDANNLPAMSLGGSPSTTLVKDDVNTLFSTVSKVAMRDGGSSYRCMYIFNQSDYTIENVRLFIDQFNPISTLRLGLSIRTAVQKIVLGGDPTDGHFTLTYTVNVSGVTTIQTTNNINFDIDVNVIAENIQDRLNELDYLSGVSVAGSTLDGDRVFLVSFAGDENFRYHQPLVVASNDLIGFTTSIEITVVEGGSPVNAIATSIGHDNQVPSDVGFFDATDAGSSVLVGRLETLDGFALWLERNTPSGTAATDQTDEASINLSGEVDQ